MKLDKWVQVAEIIGGAAIIVSLFVLILEVRQNTAAGEREVRITRFLNYTDDYIDPAAATEVWAKVKAIDGLEPLAAAYVDRYGLTPAEAVLWSRMVQRSFFLYLADFEFSGESEALATELRTIPRYPDARLAFEINEDDMLSAEFRAYAESVWEGDRQAP